MKYTRIQKHTVVKIVTSGYSDRYLASDTTITISVAGVDGTTAKCQFQSNHDARDFLLTMGMDFDTAWPIVNDAPTTMTMGARIDKHASRSMVITREEMRSVRALLILRNPIGWKQTAVDERLNWLNSHPIPEALMAIVKGQLSECDRKNTEMWGHPNGYRAGQ